MWNIILLSIDEWKPYLFYYIQKLKNKYTKKKNTASQYKPKIQQAVFFCWKNLFND